MEQYISKTALVAEIEKRRKDWWYGSSIEAKYKREECDDILTRINTLEVKDVDLEKEYKDFIKCDNGRSMFETAKHFFELGLKARTDKELIEEVYSHLDSIKDTADRMTSGNFMHHRAAIKYSANVIEKVLGLIGFKAQKEE